MKRDKIKYFRTESNYKKNNLYLDKINQFSYSLFKINDENRKKFLNNKEILLDAVITNYTNSNNIRFSNRFNDDNKKNNYNLKNMNNFFNNFLKDSKNKSTKNSSMGFNIFSKNNKELFPELNNKDNKETNNQQLILVPVFFHNKNKLKKNENNFLDSRKVLSSANSLQKKKRNTILNEFLKKKNKRRSETEENDMKPKIRFINIKKDLLDETLKINKMFGTYRKQIIQKEKEIKGQISHLYVLHNKFF